LNTKEKCIEHGTVRIFTLEGVENFSGSDTPGEAIKDRQCRDILCR